MDYEVWINEMPEDCYECPCNDDDWMCNLLDDDIGYDKRRDDCPLKLISDYRKEREND